MVRKAVKAVTPWVLSALAGGVATYWATEYLKQPVDKASIAGYRLARRAIATGEQEDRQKMINYARKMNKNIASGKFPELDFLHKHAYRDKTA